jgi:hypothetical protein
MSKANSKKTRVKKAVNADAKRVTKPARPNRFKYTAVNDPALILELQQKGIAIATIRSTLREDGTPVYTRVYWPVKAVSAATGRKPRMIRQWAEEGKFVPAQHIGGRPVWAEEDVDRLLREGDFFQQSIRDAGHMGELAMLAADALGDVLDERGNPIEPSRTPASGGDKRGGKPGMPDPLAMLRI